MKTFEQKIKAIQEIISEFGCQGICDYGPCIEIKDCEECKLEYDNWCIECRITEILNA